MQLKPPVSHTKGIIMNKLIYPLAGALMLGATLPVLAGPDFQGIEQGRKAARPARRPRPRAREMPPRPPKPAVATARPSP